MEPPRASVRLHPHPHAPCGIVDAFDVQLAFATPGVLAVTYTIRGAIDRLRIPEAPLDPERLWEHTCCELFVAPVHGESYVEWNLSPNGQHARFVFSAYRQRVTSTAPNLPAPELSRDRAMLQLTAHIPVGDAGPNPLELRLAPTAVVEDDGGALSYWALRHRSDRPDFHHADGFALVLTAGPPVAIVQR